jgi:hypothetical protein
VKSSEEFRSLMKLVLQSATTKGRTKVVYKSGFRDTTFTNHDIDKIKAKIMRWSWIIC